MWNRKLRDEINEDGMAGMILGMAIILVMTIVWPADVCEQQQCPPQYKPSDQILNMRDQILNKVEHGGCIGSFKYFSGNGFAYDYSNWKEKYDLVANADDSSVLLAPMYMSLDPEGYDCEDGVLAILCLSTYYDDVDCDMYLKFYENSKYAHVGLECSEKVGNYTNSFVF